MENRNNEVMAQEELEQLRNKIFGLMAEFDERLLERTQLVRLIFLAILSRNNMFLIGRPGVGKTFAIKMLKYIIKDEEREAKYFEYLMLKNTKHEEIFGSIIEDENGKLSYNIDGSIVDATIAFIDELFKGDSKLISSYLGITSPDRSFFMRGVGEVKVPMLAFFGASNEFPTSEELDAFDDRLVIRHRVDRIKDRANRIRLIMGDFVKSREFSNTFTFYELDRIYEAYMSIEISLQYADAFADLMERILKDGIDISDRKFVSAVDIIKACAFLNGRQEPDLSDMFIMLHVGWRDYTDQRKMKQVLWEYMFSSKDAIRSKLNEIKSVYSELHSFFKINLKDFVNMEVSIDPLDDEDEALYNKYSQTYKLFYVRINSLNDSINEIFEHKKQVVYVENLVKNNIFLEDYTNETYTNEIEYTLSDITASVRGMKERLDNFHNEAVDITKYVDYINSSAN